MPPRSLRLARSKYDIDVACHKDGRQDATGHLESGAAAMGLGNILAGA